MCRGTCLTLPCAGPWAAVRPAADVLRVVRTLGAGGHSWDDTAPNGDQPWKPLANPEDDFVTSTIATVNDAVGIDSFSEAVDTAVTEVQTLLASLAASLPRVLIALVVLAAFWVAGRLVRRTLHPRLAQRQGESVGRVISSMVTGVIITVGVLVFLAVAFPTVNVATLLGAGGVVALAAGFAFQDLAENALSGILLLLRQPFSEGDVIEVESTVGVVTAITIRETRIRRFDRQVVVVPNAQVYKNAIRIQTENPAIRSSVIVGVGYEEDLQRAEDIALAAVQAVDGVLADPAPEALYTELAGSSVNLDVRYFHNPSQGELRRVQGEVVKAIKTAYDDAEINIPFPITTLDGTDDVAEAVRAIAGRTDNGTSGNGGDPSRSRPSTVGDGDRPRAARHSDGG